MYGNMFEGLTGCLVVLLILAIVGLIALALGAYYLLSHINFSWS